MVPQAETPDSDCAAEAMEGFRSSLSKMSLQPGFKSGHDLSSTTTTLSPPSSFAPVWKYIEMNSFKFQEEFPFQINHLYDDICHPGLSGLWYVDMTRAISTDQIYTESLVLYLGCFNVRKISTRTATMRL